MTRARQLPKKREQTEYWMRSVWFPGLHRILKAVAGFPNGLRAGELNRLVADNKILLTRDSSLPAPTTLYHHRNTLLHLGALERSGRMLRVNVNNPHVCELLKQPAPDGSDQSLCDAAISAFAGLVLTNRQCRSLFFDLFMPAETSSLSVSVFRQKGFPVRWTRQNRLGTPEILFHNDVTGRTAHCQTPVSIAAVLYGLRYWARDQLKLIDEYSRRSDDSTIMFPILFPPSASSAIDSAVLQTVQLILSLRTSSEWTLFAVSELITRCCENGRLPIRVLFRAIDWLLREWPNHTTSVPTSRALATLTATSDKRDTLALRGFYKASTGPYISHIRLHRNITPIPTEAAYHESRHP